MNEMINERFPVVFFFFFNKMPFDSPVPSADWLPAASENYRHGRYCCRVVTPVMSCQRDKDAARWTIQCSVMLCDSLFLLRDVEHQQTAPNQSSFPGF